VRCAALLPGRGDLSAAQQRELLKLESCYGLQGRACQGRQSSRWLMLVEGGAFFDTLLQSDN